MLRKTVILNEVKNLDIWFSFNFEIFRFAQYDKLVFLLNINYLHFRFNLFLFKPTVNRRNDQ